MLQDVERRDVRRLEKTATAESDPRRVGSNNIYQEIISRKSNQTDTTGKLEFGGSHETFEQPWGYQDPWMGDKHKGMYTCSNNRFKTDLQSTFKVSKTWSWPFSRASVACLSINGTCRSEICPDLLRTYLFFFKLSTGISFISWCLWGSVDGIVARDVHYTDYRGLSDHDSAKYKTGRFCGSNRKDRV